MIDRVGGKSYLRKRRFKRLLAIGKSRVAVVKSSLALCFLFFGIAFLVLATPHLNDLPNDIRIREVMLDGKRYVLIEGTDMDSMSSLCVTRVYSESGGKVIVDQVSAPVVFDKTCIVNRFPMFCSLDSFGQNDLTFVARSPNRERILGRYHLEDRVR